MISKMEAEYLAQDNNFDVVFDTHVPLHEYKFKWNIRNFSAMPLTKILQSPEFNIAPKQLWHLEFKISEASMYLYLCCEDDIEGKLECLTVLSSNSNEVFYTELHKSYQTNKVKIDLISQLTKDKSENLIKREINLLIITCSVKMYNLKNMFVETYSNYKKPICHLQLLADDLNNMHINGINTDFSLLVGGVSFNAHKAILSARSPVFAKMFEHKMTESNQSAVEIDDIRACTMKIFIDYLYNPILQDSYDTETLSDLYYAADKYNVLNLRNICGDKLFNNLKENNALEVLMLADRHKDECLKENVMKFVSFHSKSVMKADSWQEFVSSNPKLASELTLCCINK